MMAIAEPELALDVELHRNKRQILITLDQKDMEYMIANDCHYNVFAAEKKNALTTLPGKGISIATFFVHRNPVSIIASKLKRLSRRKMRRKKARLFLKALMPCAGGETFESEIITKKIPTSPHGTVPQIRRLIKRMKHHMQYWEGDL